MESLKKRFQEKEGLEVRYQNLVYAGKPLRDGMNSPHPLSHQSGIFGDSFLILIEKTLEDYDIRNSSTIHLVGRVPGGAWLFD